MCSVADFARRDHLAGRFLRRLEEGADIAARKWALARRLRDRPKTLQNPTCSAAGAAVCSASSTRFRRETFADQLRVVRRAGVHAPALLRFWMFVTCGAYQNTNDKSNPEIEGTNPLWLARQIVHIL